MLDDELVELVELGLALLGPVVEGEVVGTVWVQVGPRVHVGGAAPGNSPFVVFGHMAALLLGQILLHCLVVLVVGGHGNDGGELEGGVLGNAGGVGDVGQDEEFLGPSIKNASKAYDSARAARSWAATVPIGTVGIASGAARAAPTKSARAAESWAAMGSVGTVRSASTAARAAPGRSARTMLSAGTSEPIVNH